MIAFLPPISQITRFNSRCPGRVFPAASQIREPNLARTGERDQVNVRVIHQMLADDCAVAVEQVEHALGTPCFLENFHQERAANRRTAPLAS